MKVEVVMSRILRIIQERHSFRVPFDRERPVARRDLKKILEAARWTPTAHNMQNFEILVIDSKELLRKLGNIKSQITAEFIRENFQQLSFSEEEFLEKKVGLLASMFPESWRSPEVKIRGMIRESEPTFMNRVIQDSPVLLIVIYDSNKRAPASEGDALGTMSLGCVMENMWLTAQDLGIGFQVLSQFRARPVEEEVKQILNIPEYMKIAFACRMGYPISTPAKYLRVRRDVNMFTHHNRFGNRDSD